MTRKDADTLTSECPECGTTSEHTPPAEGEIKRARTCSDCGEWMVVYERGEQ